MQCLENLVGIWDGCTTKTPGKLYINDLPGFDLSFPDYLTTNQVEDGIELLENKRTAAANFLVNEMVSHLNPRSRVGSVVLNATAGIYNKDRQTKALVAGKLRGLQLMISNYPYLKIYIDSVSFFATSSVTTNVLVYDLTSGQLLDSLPITTTANEITTIFVGKEYNNNGQQLNIALLVDASLTNVYESNITIGGCDSCIFTAERLNTFANGRGIEIASPGTINYQNVRGISHTNGLTATYSIACDHKYFICSIAGTLALPMYYRFGVELMDEVIFSKRLNSITTIHKDDAKVLKAEYQIKYEEALGNVIKNMILPNNLCYNCTPLIQNVPRIP